MRGYWALSSIFFQFILQINLLNPFRHFRHSQVYPASSALLKSKVSGFENLIRKPSPENSKIIEASGSSIDQPSN